MPFDDRQTNYMEIFNECCILAIGYILFIFTDFVMSIDIKVVAGMAIICVIGLNFGVNIIVQVI